VTSTSDPSFIIRLRFIYQQVSINGV